jgi:glutamyl-tRNA reductase
LPNVTFADVDTLSKINDETLQKRKQEVPKAIAIIKTHFDEFKDWHEMRKHVPILKEVKNKLKELHTHHNLFSNNITSSHTYSSEHEEKIQKVVNVLAMKMRHNNAPGCHYIEAINEYIA